MGRIPVIRVATFVLVTAAAVMGWLLLGPAELGGPVRYAIIEGSSMVPALTDGDLAIVRVDGEPEKGKVVLYHDPRLGVDVLHRVVRGSGGRFVLKGDGNDYLDDARPTEAELGGTLWLSVPYLGSAVEWLRQPLHIGLVVFVLAALALAGGGSAAAGRRVRPGSTMGITSAGTNVEVASRAFFTGALVAAVLFGLLALLTFSRPVSRAEVVDEARVHEGTLSYSAIVEESDVYPDGAMNTGETAFLQLVPALDIAFAYRFTAESPSDVSGHAMISAVVSDGAGWVREVPVADPRRFTGPHTTVRGTLDLSELAEIVGEMKRLTGSLTTTFSVRVEPRVEVTGQVGSDALDSAFAPGFRFLLDDVGLRVDASEDGLPALEARSAEPGSVDVPGALALGGLRVSVERARSLAVLGLVMSLLLAIFAATALSIRRRDGEHGRLAARFGDRMISIARAPAVDAARVTDLTDPDSLVRIAERYDQIGRASCRERV